MSMEELVYSALKITILIALTEITKRLGLVEKYIPTALQPVAISTVALSDPAMGALAAATVAGINGLASRFGPKAYLSDPTAQDMGFIVAWTGKSAEDYEYTVAGHINPGPGHRGYHLGRKGELITVVFKE